MNSFAMPLRSLWIGIFLSALLLGGCATKAPGTPESSTPDTSSAPNAPAAPDAPSAAPRPAPSGVEIRIANQSDRDFDWVDVTFGSQKVGYGPVERGGRSEYKEAQEAYRYALVEVKAGGETFRFQPIDFVGETPLAPGLYTYTLNIDPNDRMVTIDLVQS